MQNKAALGKRYTCFSCGAKFYDLNKPEATCPKCGTDQAADPSPDPRVAVMARYKAGARPTAIKKKIDAYKDDLDDDDAPMMEDDEDDATPADLGEEEVDDEG